jgi:HK97 family phage major capsid protein/HK97 family phage prohead protease
MYSTFKIKAVQEDQRMIEGIASTPTPDRMNDVVEVDGIAFSLPMPFLYQHNADQPIGHVISAKKTSDGLVIKAQMAADIGIQYINEAWALIKAGLVQGLSIGFRSVEEAYNRDTGGYHFIKTDLYEISAVTIPANAEATILNVKSAAQAALGHKRSGSISTAPSIRPGVSGLSTTDKNMKTIQEQIASSEAKMLAHDTRIDAIIAKTIEESRTPEQDENDEIELLRSESKRLGDYIALLRTTEADRLRKAQRVTVEAGQNAGGAQVETGRRFTSVSSDPIIIRSADQRKGIGMARVAMALMTARLEGEGRQYAAELARKRWPDSPEVEVMIRTKAAIDAGDTTTSGWASQLIPAAVQLQGEFLGVFRPQTIIGRIPGLRRVPFNIAVPIETASGTAQWVGEGAPKPLTKLTLTNKTLLWAKCAAIVAITKELARFSQPDAETVVRDSMVQTLINFYDAHFISATAAVTSVSPAGILNGISSTAVTGTTAAALRTDLATILQKMTAHKVPLTNIVLLMSATTAAALSMMITDLGVRLFPDITRVGGLLETYPVIISEAVGTNIIALNASDVLLAEDPGVQVDVSDQASVEMSDTPLLGDESPVVTASTIYKSFWQNNLIGIRVEQYITWAVARSASVEYLTAAAYKP